ncbi:MAG: hypothetical protein DI629_03640 [Mesorhizobium amorphae]|nr:MAG: hypothetical protein DI629_03640 [Mesorhizobium amorphae]
MSAAPATAPVRTDRMDIPAVAVLIHAGHRLHHPDFIATLAADILPRGLIQPIEVVALDAERFRLVDGRARLEAVCRLGWGTVPALVWTAPDYLDEAAERLRGVRANLLRQNLTALDRAFAVMTWREVYLTTQNVIGRGRPKKQSQLETDFRGSRSAEDQAGISEAFSLSLTDAARRFLGIERASLFRMLAVTAIGQTLRERISLHPIADNQSELLQLAREGAERWGPLVDLLTDEKEPAETVSAAIARLDRRPAVAEPERWQKLSATFARLTPTQQDRFFELHEEAVMAWAATRTLREGSR